MTESDAKPACPRGPYTVRSKSNRAICHIQWAFPVVAEPIVQGPRLETKSGEDTFSPQRYTQVSSSATPNSPFLG